MVSAVTFAPNGLFGCAPSSTPSHRSCSTPGGETDQNGIAIRDEFSLSSFSLRVADDGSYEQSGLRVASRSIVRVGEDGQLSVRSDARLRFRYEFQSADGTKISVRAKANLHYAYRSDGTLDTESLKLQVKFRASVVQQNVADGLNPLLDVPQIPEELQNALTAAAQLFQQTSDGITAAFLDAAAPDGDALITSLVNAFNELTGSLREFVIPSQPALPDDAGTPSDADDAGDLALPESVSAPSSDVEQSPVVIETVPSSVDSSPPAPAADAGPADIPAIVVENEPVAETVGDPPASESPAETESAPAPATPDDARTVVSRALFDLRVRVVASLQSLTQVFDTDTGSSTLLATRLDVFASAKLSAAYSTSSAPDETAASQPANLVDVQA